MSFAPELHLPIVATPPSSKRFRTPAELSRLHRTPSPPQKEAAAVVETDAPANGDDEVPATPDPHPSPVCPPAPARTRSVVVPDSQPCAQVEEPSMEDAFGGNASVKPASEDRIPPNQQELMNNFGVYAEDEVDHTVVHGSSVQVRDMAYQLREAVQSVTIRAGRHALRAQQDVMTRGAGLVGIHDAEEYERAYRVSRIVYAFVTDLLDDRLDTWSRMGMDKLRDLSTDDPSNPPARKRLRF